MVRQRRHPCPLAMPWPGWRQWQQRVRGPRRAPTLCAAGCWTPRVKRCGPGFPRWYLSDHRKSIPRMREGCGRDGGTSSGLEHQRPNPASWVTCGNARGEGALPPQTQGRTPARADPPPLPPALACPYGLTAAAAAAPGPARSLTSAPGVDPQPSCQRCSAPPPRLLGGLGGVSALPYPFPPQDESL